MKKGLVKFEWSIALIASLVLHFALFGWLVRGQIRELAALLERGADGFRLMMADGTAPNEDELGDSHGTGTAIAPSEGDQPALGIQADMDQPLLSRDPVGQGHIGDAPTQYTGPTGHGSLADAMQQSIASQDMPSLMPNPSEAGLPSAPHPPAKPEKTIGPTLIKPPDKPTPLLVASAQETTVEPQPQAQPTPPAPPMAAPSPRSKSPPSASADPAPQADSEIDVFSKAPSVVFRAGKMSVQYGRKCKLTRPKVPLVGQWDGVALGRAAVTLHLTLDETGHVIRATIDKSSGSSDIDNPIRLESYNWWFEPRRNVDGQLIDTDFPFTVVSFD
jgi:hypothetical protein